MPSRCSRDLFRRHVGRVAKQGAQQTHRVLLQCSRGSVCRGQSAHRLAPGLAHACLLGSVVMMTLPPSFIRRRVRAGWPVATTVPQLVLLRNPNNLLFRELLRFIVRSFHRGLAQRGNVKGDRAARGTFSFAGVPDLTITASESTSVNWMGSIRGRLGFTWWNQVLVYATGGLAFADIESDRNVTFSRAIGGFSGTSFSNSVSDTVWGWTIGTGVEWAFAPNWTTRLEYRYTKFRRGSSKIA